MTEVCNETVVVPGPRGRLHGELSYPPADVRGAALVLNPHPLMGGRIDNNVIAQLGADLPGAGLVTLRFDYAGVGDSEGDRIDVASSMQQFWATGRATEDPRMVDDAMSALGWLRAEVDGPMVVVGYSFGAFVAAEVAAAEGCDGLALISPTVTQHAFDVSAIESIETLVVHGDDDFATTAEAFQGWCRTLNCAEVVHVPGGAHFFRGCEDAVAAACCRFALRVTRGEEAVS